MAFQKTNGSNDNSLKWHKGRPLNYSRNYGYGFETIKPWKSANEGDKGNFKNRKTIGRMQTRTENQK